MRELKSLWVWNSVLEDDDLQLLAAFPNLRVLDLRNCRINGPGLRFLAELENLQELTLNEADITDDCLPHLLKMSPKLRGIDMKLTLGSTWISEAGRQRLEVAGMAVHVAPLATLLATEATDEEALRHEFELVKMAHFMTWGRFLLSERGLPDAFRCNVYPDSAPIWLRLSGMRLLTSELELIESWSELRFLDLTSLHIAGVTFYQNRRKYVLPGLAGMPKLTTLSLAGTGVGDHAIRPLSRCGKLKYLDLRMTDLHGEGLKALSDLRGLEVLRLSHNMIEDDSLAALTGLTSLKRLELDSTDITDEGLTHLRSLTNLEELSTSHTRVTKAAAEQFQKQSGLRGLTTFREYDPKPKLQTGPALRPLIGIGDGSVGRAVNKRREAPYTEELIRRGFELTGRVDDGRTGTLVSTSLVTDDDLRFASRLLGLKSVSVSAAELTPVGVWYLKRLPELESLTLTGPDLSTELFSQIPELTPLRNLTLRECDIDDTGLQLIAASSTLKSVRLELSSDSKLSEDSLSKAEAGGISIKVVSPEETSPTSIAD